MRIGFIGAGQMARALASGFVRNGIVAGHQVLASDCSEQACLQFTSEIPGASIAATNRDAVNGTEATIVAVKPQHIGGVFQAVGSVSSETLMVSIVAGVTLRQLSDGFSTDRIVRVMPNTPCLIGQGASGFCLGSAVEEDDAALVRRLLESVGICFEFHESIMDTVTGLSGSGPAYVYQFIEALSDGAVRMGMPRAMALSLAAQTVAGAAQMVMATGEHPAVLKDRVASPGGTTIAGIDALEQAGFRGSVISAVRAATERSKQLGE